jgi:hypothetical protein
MLNARVSIRLAVMALLCSAAAAEAACQTGQKRDCVLNLDSVPQISQQIVAKQRVAPAAKAATTANSETPYTGPTVGLTPTVRRVPTVGYHWSFD